MTVKKKANSSLEETSSMKEERKEDTGERREGEREETGERVCKKKQTRLLKRRVP